MTLLKGITWHFLQVGKRVAIAEATNCGRRWRDRGQRTMSHFSDNLVNRDFGVPDARLVSKPGQAPLITDMREGNSDA